MGSEKLGNFGWCIVQPQLKGSGGAAVEDAMCFKDLRPKSVNMEAIASSKHGSRSHFSADSFIPTDSDSPNSLGT
ncbi:unnamed protein product [Citrullus colocynthis]|uniref:Uncharacterized protein n=1 Tax=Citrullus colocynthis TaxID=252529 RepID=A0ABP0Z4E6_9ROSI